METKLQKELNSFWNTRKVSFLDTTPLFRNFAPNQFTYTIDIHWNKKGNQHAAEVIEYWIKNEKIFFD